eukprot:1743502-Pleurochrysis_carterae.AAC.3
MHGEDSPRRVFALWTSALAVAVVRYDGACSLEALHACAIAEKPWCVLAAAAWLMSATASVADIDRRDETRPSRNFLGIWRSAWRRL